MSVKRDKAAAMYFFDKSMLASGIPEQVTMDLNGSHKAVIDQINESIEVPKIIRRAREFNNRVEKDHHVVKRNT